MKKYIIVFALGIFALACTQSATGTENPIFEILPTPQQVEITGSSDIDPASITNYSGENLDLPTTLPFFKNTSKPSFLKISVGAHRNLADEGYSLRIDKKSISIMAKDKAGALYGMMTLRQLIEDATDQNVNLPMVEIVDAPKLAYRAIHLDVKHHMETKDYYYKLMDRLAGLKINGIIIEIEDKMQFKSQPKVASPDAWSMEEWRKLSDYAYARNIEISPLVQGLGHASFILKHDEYKHLRDDPKSDWAFNPLDPETYEVQFDLYRDAMAAFPHGKYLHVGGDEVHTTGRGSGRSQLDLQLSWLDKVCKFAEDNGRTPIFWDDMPLKHAGFYRPMFDNSMSKEKVDSIWEKSEPELVKFIDRFPENCIYMRWNYQTPGTHGNIKAMDWFASNGFQVMGATAGQTRWKLMPQNQSNIPSIRTFALSSIDKKLDGLLLTLWDDDSPHFELYSRGIMSFAEYTWAGDQKTIDEVKAAYRHRQYGPELRDEKYSFIDKLEAPVAFWNNALLSNGHRRNDLRKLKSPENEAVIDLPDLNNKGQWSEAHQQRIEEAKKHLASVEEVLRQIDEVKKNNVRNEYNLDVYEQVAKLVQFSLKTLVDLEKLDLSDQTSETKMKEKILTIERRFSELRSELEEVYGQTRVLHKPDNYILDQDHHIHTANQSINFDWLFFSELYMISKILTTY